MRMSHGLDLSCGTVVPATHATHEDHAPVLAPEA